MSRDSGSPFTDSDRDLLQKRGVSRSEADRQLSLLRNPPSPTRLLRAATLGDGIRLLPLDDPELLHEFRRAAESRRLARFVPASGAATRMFKRLLDAAKRDDPWRDPDARWLRDEIDRFAFAPLLDEKVREADPLDGLGDLLAAVLGPGGLNLAALPKGLVPFHRGPDGQIRTAFEDQLAEVGHLIESAHATRPRCARVHFTVPAHGLPAFEEELARVKPRVERAMKVELDVTFSVQQPDTDTLALTAEGMPFREDETLLLRPGGHGALINNLQAFGRAGADIVSIKNIDNVLPAEHQSEVTRSRRGLIGLVLRLERQTHFHLAALAADPTPGHLESAAEFAAQQLNRQRATELLDEEPELCRLALIALLDRPLRVCGMVRNQGEPGGGPFWVADDAHGEALQIIESAQIDKDDPEQRAILQSSTHFNPVDLVCTLRDLRGDPFELTGFIDESTWFVAEKSHGGRFLRALERPGLWNGAMGGWTTVFVEVPAPTFTPVKTVFDLLRPEHQTRSSP